VTELSRHVPIIFAGLLGGRLGEGSSHDTASWFRYGEYWKARARARDPNGASHCTADLEPLKEALEYAVAAAAACEAFPSTVTIKTSSAIDGHRNYSLQAYGEHS
jgi:hypothetical protein